MSTATLSAALALDFSEITLADISRVGGKNASLGQMFNNLGSLGVGVLDGFATTAEAYRALLATAGLREKLQAILAPLNPGSVRDIAMRGRLARAIVLDTPIPREVRSAVIEAYHRLRARLGREPELAVRSSATAEDLPGASFAGQQDTFLGVRGVDALMQAVHACFASLFTDRAISYRAERGFDHMDVALSVGVQPMVRSDLGCAGVMFTLHTESGFRDVVVINGSYGLGELVVQGMVIPDEWIVFKSTLAGAPCPIVARTLGRKEILLGYDEADTRQMETTAEQRRRFCLDDADVLRLARWGCIIEEHYSGLAGRSQPMDIEWAKDGHTGELYIVQARPETVHSAPNAALALERYRITGSPPAAVVTGQAVGEKIGVGRVRVVRDVQELAAVDFGDVLVAETTNPDWEPVMKRVAAIVTDKGGRTAHAAIVSRELGLPCIVGAGNATSVLHDGDAVSVSCAEGNEGHVYPGRIAFEVEQVDTSELPRTRTHMMLNVGDPAQAFKFASLPNDGVGLARTEFIVADHIGIHPMALVRYPRLASEQVVAEIAARIGSEDPREFFIRRLSEGIGTIAAAFYPKPVIVRTSDFKTNEYARLLGGAEFEPTEENPMLGFRGASRYYDARYAEGFALECAALLRVRREMGLTNLKVMIPFCRTPQEGRNVVEVMERNGLRRDDKGLEIYVMCELPSNVVQADAFLEVFDGFSIGSNDLTQLVLGVDRDSGTVAHLFDEQDEAVRTMIASAIAAARRAGKPIGICGQAPSDHPAFAAWLVAQGITSISLNPDSVLKASLIVAEAERNVPAALHEERILFEGEPR